MKKVILITLLGMFLVSGTVLAATEVTLRQDTGYSKSIELTLSGTPGTVTTVTIPDTAIGIKIYPQTNDIRFAVNQTVAAKTTSGATTIVVSDLATGSVAKANQWETRILPPYYGTSRTMTLSSASASVVVELECF